MNDVVVGPRTTPYTPLVTSREAGELLDNELEHVVGGLQRAWEKTAVDGDATPAPGLIVAPAPPMDILRRMSA